MKKQAINIVWLKRDLRTQDHYAFYAAELMQLPYLIIYLFEPSLYQQKDTSERHLQFIYHSLLGLNQTLKQAKHSLTVLNCEAIEAFEYITNQFDVQAVFSYQESGTAITWDRDKQVNSLFKSKKIEWKEYQRDNVIRGISNRLNWKNEWLRTMNLPILENTYSPSLAISLQHPYPLNPDLKNIVTEYPKHFQPAGEYNAWRYLKSFANDRGKKYFKHISKPLESRTSCGRISPYLAWGNLSVKQAYHYVNNHSNLNTNKRAYEAFLLRLQWRCHFVQKFEVECTYETATVNSGFENLPYEENEKMYMAWEKGNTGFPLIDACMRCVTQTGWINFRMRAMLLSLLCHHMNIDWRKGVYHLANQFLDYEPGIHFPQFQMQAGTTGTNLVRIYNPIKQSQDHDPEGIFIKKWLPELANVPDAFIHEPWKMTAIDQAFCGVEIGKDYPMPFFDIAEKGKIARERIWGHQNKEEVLVERERILNTHVNPKTKKNQTSN